MRIAFTAVQSVQLANIIRLGRVRLIAPDRARSFGMPKCGIHTVDGPIGSDINFLHYKAIAGWAQWQPRHIAKASLQAISLCGTMRHRHEGILTAFILRLGAQTGKQPKSIPFRTLIELFGARNVHRCVFGTLVML